LRKGGGWLVCETKKELIKCLKIVHILMLSKQGFITPPNLPLPQGEEYPPSWVKRGEGGVTFVNYDHKFIAMGVHPTMRLLITPRSCRISMTIGTSAITNDTPRGDLIFT